ncbi:ABC transporter permease subunit [Pigmentibacter sp. JX0631]|uniref:ABC transporter permease n=1 Tax=Pigmentibacter sp. JX0631 TaxID=2976982 RepID=UPI002469B382|nr:ABC transporter permease subunit [Pigmentibacter sp. JX0631]WGL60311.1 ABC transporter permease subunit [Pigmentibacter sp. JX0631]
MSRISKLIFPVFFVMFLTFIAELTLQKAKVPEYIIPLPSKVTEVFLADWEILLQNTKVTTVEWLIGVFLSIIIGFFLAIISYKFSKLRAFLSPFLTISQSVPYLVFIPLLMIWLGLGMAPKIVLVVLTCSFPIAIVLQNDLLNSYKEYFLFTKMLKIKPIKAFFHIYFPNSLPGFFNALKISVSYSFGSTVLAELMGSEEGLGIYLLRAQATFRTDKVIAVVLIIITISLISTKLVSFISEKIIFWNSTKK